MFSCARGVSRSEVRAISRKKDMSGEDAMILSHIQAAGNEGMCRILSRAWLAGSELGGERGL